MRTASDFEYEQWHTDFNRRLGGIETILLYTEPELTSVSSSAVREPAAFWRRCKCLYTEKTLTMIIYEAEGVKFPNIKKRETTSWIRQVAASYGKKVGEIGYLFVNDEKILEVNNQFLGHDYYTDIITFDYCEGKTISGDIYISVDTVFTNADKFGRPYDEEPAPCNHSRHSAPVRH